MTEVERIMKLRNVTVFDFSDDHLVFEDEMGYGPASGTWEDLSWNERDWLGRVTVTRVYLFKEGAPWEKGREMSDVPRRVWRFRSRSGTWERVGRHD